MAMFNFCPSCASEKIEFNGRNFRCPDCGFTYFHNTAAATGCVIESGGRVVLEVRGKEPSRGKLGLPGGFVDPGEGLLEGLCRELKEELGWLPAGVPVTGCFEFYASFPNTYPYKNIIYNTCDIFFTISVPGLTEKDFSPDPVEIAGIRFMRPEDINPDELAFDSTRLAISAYIQKYRQPAAV
ncbi:MAG: NUDIX domain-containing protein [Treponema sp.]|nr:NUDIX domain-containing protein [Treponema sp.]